MTLKRKDYFKPTKKRFKLYGDAALVLIPVIYQIIENAPNGLTDNQKYWVLSVVNISLVLFKFWTNTMKEDEGKAA
jgi:hypothetical protein